MVLFFPVFNRLAGLTSDGAPYQVFNFPGLVPVTSLATAVGTGALGLVSRC